MQTGIMDKPPFTVASKAIKCLRINLSKDIKDLFNENGKISLSYELAKLIL